jgi:hypothetical protein
LGIPDFDPLNGRSGEIRCVAKSVPPQLQTNAASATWQNANVLKVRIAVLEPRSDHAMAANVQFDRPHCSIAGDR